MKFCCILLFSLITILFSTQAFAQESYQDKKLKKLAVESPFEKIIKRELPADIVFEDDDVIAFLPLELQAPVHILIVPKKRIATMNDMTEDDIPILGKMFFVAKQLAEKKGISESGYRLSINTNEDAGQSVFHLHLHLYGGEKLNPMIEKKEN